MRIMRHGTKPEDEKLYFLCGRCRCEFTAKKRECEFESDGYRGGEFVAACPDCGKIVVGTNREKYMTKKLKNL